MSFDVDTQAQLRAAITKALRNTLDGVDVSPHSDEYLKAAALAHVMEGLSKKLRWTSEQIFPDSSDDDILDRHAALYEIERKDPTKASGTAKFSGTPGASVPIGVKFTKADGKEYATTAAGVIAGSGTADVAAEASEAGADGNCEAGESFTLSSPPGGIDSTAEAAEDFTGGTDEETSAALLARLLDRIQYPPAGGTASDWVQWAMEVDGVYLAWAHPLVRGPGTIDVTIVTLGSGGHLDLPDATLLTNVETYLESQRPVTTKDFQVVNPDKKWTVITIDDLEVVDGYDGATVADAVEDALEDLFDSYATGETLYLHQLYATISGVAGVKNFTLTAPAADVEPEVSSVKIEIVWIQTITVNLA